MSPKICAVQKKTKYATKRLAIRVAIKSSQRRGVALRVYYHAACGSWHLSSKPRLDWSEDVPRRMKGTSSPRIDIHTERESA